jgi:predicted nucleotidyltransferase
VPGCGNEFRRIEATLRKVAAALREANLSFALGGSVAAWAHGGPESCNDLDFMITEQDAEAALHALTQAGMTAERPPEEWLVKAWDGDMLVDLIYHAAGVPITNEVLERAPVLSVFSIRMRVLTLEDVMTSKLLALRDHALDYEPVLMIARALRERTDWEEVRRRTADSPYARTFFALLAELGIDTSGGAESGGRDRSRIRVLPSEPERV